MSSSKAKAAPKPAVDDWETEQDLHHLTKAHQIKSDPKRHKAAMAMAKSKMEAMKAAVGDTDKDGM